MPPAPLDDNDTSSVELGTKFRADVNGFITGVRFYKSAAEHRRPHRAASGPAPARCSARSPSQARAPPAGSRRVSDPVAVTANTTYVVSYHSTDRATTPETDGFFASRRRQRAAARARATESTVANGVYRYGASAAFPTNTFNSENYWVDVVFATSTAPDTTPPQVSSVTPASGATGVAVATAVTADFNEASIRPRSRHRHSSSGIQRTRSSPATVTYSAGSRTATLTAGHGSGVLTDATPRPCRAAARA